MIVNLNVLLFICLVTGATIDSLPAIWCVYKTILPMIIHVCVAVE